MERDETIALSTSLRRQELKVKYLSGESYVKLLSLRRKIDVYLKTMSEDEKIAAEDFNINTQDEFFKNLDFQKKLKEIQKRKFDHNGQTNFIEESEFDNFVRKTDIDFDSCYLLEIWLLK
jgi:hypothetical protein